MREHQVLLIQQMREVHREFPELLLQKAEDGRFFVTGCLAFSVETEKGTILEDAYQVKISIPPDYPQSVPTVREVGGRIPKEFHRHPHDGTLCLGAPLAVRMAFHKDRSLLGYIRNQVVPYLFAHSYNEEYEEMPYEQLPHGGEGILLYYREVLGVNNILAVLGLLRVLVDDSYRGHYDCPCGSGRNLRKCHGPALLAVKDYQNQDDFLVDFLMILRHVTRTKDIEEFLSVLPLRLTEQLPKLGTVTSCRT